MLDGVHAVSYGDGIRIKATVKAVEKLFSCAMHVFQHAPTGKRAIRQRGGLSIPPHVASYIELVTSLTNFPIIPMAKPHARSHPVDQSSGSPPSQTISSNTAYLID